MNRERWWFLVYRDGRDWRVASACIVYGDGVDDAEQEARLQGINGGAGTFLHEPSCYPIKASALPRADWRGRRLRPEHVYLLNAYLLHREDERANT